MASASEAMGMTLPGSSSFPAEYPEKLAECDSTGSVMRNLLEKNILPRDIMTRSAFENAMVSSSYFENKRKKKFTVSEFISWQVLTMVLGGSTNAVGPCLPILFARALIRRASDPFQVLHLLAMARAADVELNIDDFQTVRDRTPYLCDLRYVHGRPFQIV